MKSPNLLTNEGNKQRKSDAFDTNNLSDQISQEGLKTSILDLLSPDGKSTKRSDRDR